MSLTQEKLTEIANKFKESFPDHALIFTSPALLRSWDGIEVLNYNGLNIISSKKSLQKPMGNDELKEQLFCWIYDTREVKEMEKRRNILAEKIDEKFPGYKYYIGLKNEPFIWCFRNCIAGCYYEKYGGYILIVLY